MNWSVELIQYAAAGIVWIASILGAIATGRQIRQRNSAGARLEGFAAAVNDVYKSDPIAHELKRIADVLERKEKTEKDAFQQKIEDIFEHLDFAEQMQILKSARNNSGT